jgi:hypothetical protein
MTEPYLTTEQLAARWGISPATLKGQRTRGTGPDYYTLPRLSLASGTPRVRYPLAQVLAFEEAHSITPVQPS